jgi:hypothetical protein
LEHPAKVQDKSMLKCGREIKPDIHHHSSSGKMNVMVRLDLCYGLKPFFIQTNYKHSVALITHFLVQEVHSTGWLVSEK